MEKALNIPSLFEQIAGSSPRAFQLFFDFTYTKTYKYACYFIDDKELCKEVVSDVYFYLWQNREKLPEVRNLDNYLFICARNQALHHIRESNRFQKIKLETIYPEEISDRTNPELELTNNELKNIIELAINELPNRCRLIFFMVREEGMKYKEVAQVLSISDRTVHAQMCIAVKRLSEVVKNYLFEKKIRK